LRIYESYLWLQLQGLNGFLCFVDRASQYNRVKENQLDAQPILSIFRNPTNCDPTRTTDSHLKIIISAKCCIHTFVPPDDGPRYARNMYRLTKCTENKLCIKLGFHYTFKWGFYPSSEGVNFPKHLVRVRGQTSGYK
jgi:hypothetical protein